MSGLLQRACACGQHVVAGGSCSACLKETQSLRRTTRQSEDVPAIVHEVLGSTGRPLNAATRAFFEPQFGHDFSKVRVHTGARATESARSVNARAYTVGKHIVFDSAQYTDGTNRRLLAHELAHVVQQQAATELLQPLRVSKSDEASEIEAEHVADQIDAGFPVHPSALLSRPVIARQPRHGGESSREPAAERPLSRPEEIQQSFNSPGEVTGSIEPVRFSLYNFPINSAALKERHRRAIRELGSLIRQAQARNLVVMVVGHADSSGDPVTNNPLSRRRAQAVQQILQQAAATSVTANWAGEEQPVATNETIEGRNRNRRVDVHFYARSRPIPPPVPPPIIDGPPPPPPPPPPPQPRRPEQLPNFCEIHPVICAALVGVGIAAVVGGAVFLLCRLNPTLCAGGPRIPVLPPPPPPPGDRDSERPEEQRRRPRACPVSVGLPSGDRPARWTHVFDTTWWLHDEFEMQVSFINDDTGCDCNAGEYKQVLSGYAERDYGTGVMQSETIPLVGGNLDRAVEREDARNGVAAFPYGHRYWDSLTRTQPRRNQQEDSFLPDRERGCAYRGGDEPRMISSLPGEHIRFRFAFRGGPVDNRRGRQPAGPWNSWVVWGDRTVPLATPPSGGTTPPPTAPVRQPPPSPSSQGAQPPVRDTYGMTSDTAIRNYVLGHSLADVGRIPLVEKLRLINRLLNGWVAPEDTEAITRICRSVITPQEMAVIRRAIAPRVIELLDYGQRIEIRDALGRI